MSRLQERGPDIMTIQMDRIRKVRNLQMQDLRNWICAAPPEDREVVGLYCNPLYGSSARAEADFVDVGYYPTSWGDADTVLNKCLSLAKRKSLLDIGSGNRTSSHVATQHGFLVTALEPNENSRAIFREVNGFRPQEQFFDRTFADGMAYS